MGVINSMIGKTMFSVVNDGNRELIFTDMEGVVYRFYHSQDCCETVVIEEIIGDLNDLINSPITMAEETVSRPENSEDYWESTTWTFYKFATVNGYVTVRWCGSSNGWYSESVYLHVFDSKNIDLEDCE